MTNTLLPTLDLKTVRFRLARDFGWNDGVLDAVEAEYRAFLLLCSQQPDFTPVPTKAVDEFWHYHILDTTKYIMDCITQFGTLIHHNPETEELSVGEQASAQFNFETSNAAISKIMTEAGMTLGTVMAWPFRRKEEPRRPSYTPSPSPSPTPTPTPSSCSYTSPMPVYTPSSCGSSCPSPSSCGGGGSSCGGGGSSCGGGGCGSCVRENAGVTIVAGHAIPLSSLLSTCKGMHLRAA